MIRHCAVLLLVLLGMGPPSELQAQDVQTPTDVVNRFLGAFQRLAWQGVAAQTHPEVLETFRFHVASMADHSADNAVATRILRGSGASDLADLDDPALFVHILAALYEEVPMLVGVLATNEYSTLGAVPEADTLAHVTVRTTAHTTGSTSSNVEVVTLRRTATGWRVADAPALDALLVALGTFSRE